MAQEPINHHQHQHDPPKQPPPREADDDDHRIQEREPLPPPTTTTRNQRLQLQLGGDGHHNHHHHHHQEVAGTSGSSSGGSSSNNGGGGTRDWLRLATGPASPGASAGSDHDLFPSTTTTAPAPQPPTPTPTPRHHHHDVLVLPGMPPPGSFLRPGPAMPGIPQASIPTHMPRAAPPWLPPWSPVAAPPPLLPFPHQHRAFYAAAPTTTPPASSGFDAIRVVLPPSAVAAAAGVWFVLQAAPLQGREPFLPQIPRSYLRIKDGRVTVRLLTKYLVNKLGLEDESEVRGVCLGWHISPPSPLDKSFSIHAIPFHSIHPL
uniref:Uncharacterized protein n=1 Tax=Oryza glaberrima TaxID=4538 RepID=I1PKS5_ORYGL